jgi:hypothetical protein
MGLIHLECPSCGGTLTLSEGERIVRCGYCRGAHLVLVPGAVPRYVVSLMVTEDEARARAQAALRRPGVPRLLREHARFQDVLLCYVPFYESTAIRLGTFSFRESAETSRFVANELAEDWTIERWSGGQPTEKEDTKVIEQDAVQVGAACELPELGVERIRLADLRRGAAKAALEAFDLVALQSRAVVFWPSKSLERFIGEATWRIRTQGDSTRYVEQRLKILYYPVWQAQYRYRGRLYDIAVDGVSGVLLRGQAPLEPHGAIGLAVSGLALAAFSIGRVVGLEVAAHSPLAWLGTSVAGHPGSMAILGLGTVVGFALAWQGWAKIQQRGVQSLEGEVGQAGSEP